VEISIEKASNKDIPGLISLFKKCTQAMINVGVFQWNEDYPDQLEIAANVNNNEVWITAHNNQIVGTITLNQFESPEYECINWTCDSFIVVHRLAVDPTYQGNGIARRLMDFAENHCSTNSIKSVRLDTYTGNKRNLKFYHNRGYNKLGEVHFRGILDPFDCFEKLVK